MHCRLRPLSSHALHLLRAVILPTPGAFLTIFFFFLLPIPISRHSHRFVSSKRDSDAHRTLPFFSSVFHSPEEAFHLDYEKMEEEFKVFVYPDGDPKSYFHMPRNLTGKYASKRYFFKSIRESHFFTNDPCQAHLFFLPISCHKMRGRGLTNERMIDEVKNYDDDDYIPHQDVTLPQGQLPFFHPPPGGNDIKNRNTLAFWAGRSDSRLKDELTAMWENDTELDIQNNRVDLRPTGPVVYMEKLY
ncbi:glycosyltransferase protein [Spatholobus suberectus]|nr:glycosyltransferase protein [Spatholobus suberectus]